MSRCPCCSGIKSRYILFFRYIDTPAKSDHLTLGKPDTESDSEKERQSTRTHRTKKTKKRRSERRGKGMQTGLVTPLSVGMLNQFSIALLKESHGLKCGIFLAFIKFILIVTQTIIPTKWNVQSKDIRRRPRQTHLI